MKKNKNIRSFKPIRPAKRTEMLYRIELLKVYNMIKDTIYKHLNSDNPASDQLELALDEIDNLDVGLFSKITGEKILKTASKDNLQKILKDLESKGISLDQIKIKRLENKKKIEKTFDECLKENVTLIKSVKTELRHDIENVLKDTVFTKDLGRRNILKTVSEKLEISRSRAKMIARDQTAKINAQLSEDRYTSLGLDIYRWSTAMDKRVRSSHAGLDRALCKYSDPTVYSTDGGKTWKDRGNLYKGKPAEDYQCRCTAIPILPYEL